MTHEGEPATPKSSRAAREEEILAFWQEQNIFDKTLTKPSPRGEFVFYEGPPTANGRPGIHHLESRAFKDAIPRYKTMRGFHVRRKGGWDTHGLPVEIEVEKELGLKSKKEIEAYGVGAFNEKCRESVWKYVAEWEEFTTRIGYWVDQKTPYITYTADYIESLWYIFKRIAKKKLLYKDYKVVPWCPRCGTPLSSHELAQGYKDVEDSAVYVKFKATDGDEYFLAWTTTPWTLPGNVALAVGEDIHYVKVTIDGDEVWIAKERRDAIAPDAPIIAEVAGHDLIGRTYEPVFDYFKNSLPPSEESKSTKAYTIYPAQFVSTEEGTGIVHTAVMYGQDDFELGTNIGLPKHHLVTEEGTFTADVGEYKGMFVKDADPLIIEALEKKGLLLQHERITHTYPFCWRCKTPLIYYARDSWYIAMSCLRKKLIRENQKINWEPAHIKDGRFGEWLREVKDWAISRNRYWGTPLPIWQCTTCEKTEVIGSVQELQKRTKRSGNKYFVMRHGQSVGNTEYKVNYKATVEDGLTEVGKKQVQSAFRRIRAQNIDLIITSPLQRTKETAEMVCEYLGLDREHLITDERIQEFRVGDFQGKTWNEYHDTYTIEEQFDTVPAGGGETRMDVARRAGEFLYELERTYKDKKILLVTHEGIVEMLIAVAGGANRQRAIELVQEHSMDNAELKEIPFVPLPHNTDYELDLHRPFIDNVEVVCRCGGVMERVPEVMDVWFDSGAMPFAQDHYPFENKRWVDWKGYPADYISEAIDQTRGWFYTLHAVGVLMKRKRAYNNVICLGHLLDAEGKKMSKSVGNVVNPWEMIKMYGVDVLRYWMYTVNQPGESKNFDERTVNEIVKKVFNIVENIVAFYDLYADPSVELVVDSPHVLDQWICAKIHTLVKEAGESLDTFKVLEPARALRDFITDFSTWYIRRSRDRFKGDDAHDKALALGTTRYILLELAKVMAPFTPFIAEDIYLHMRGPQESVHLDEWPQEHKVDASILTDMQDVRDLVSRALESRATAGIKVRQPLARLTVRRPESTLVKKEALVDLIKDEVNVKEVVFEEGTGWDVELDTVITSELKAEGQLRDFIRAVQNARKNGGVSPQDIVELRIKTDDAGRSFVENFKTELQQATSLGSILFEDIESGDEVTIDDLSFTLKVQK